LEGNPTEGAGVTETMDEDATVLASTLRKWPHIAIHITKAKKQRIVINKITIHQLAEGRGLPGLTNAHKPTL